MGIMLAFAREIIELFPALYVMQVQYAMEIILTTKAINNKDKQLSVRALGQINSCKLNQCLVWAESQKSLN